MIVLAHNTHHIAVEYKVKSAARSRTMGHGHRPFPRILRESLDQGTRGARNLA
jgi:hypothetical protein